MLPRSGQPVLHAVYAQELRDAMRELNVQTSQQTWMRIYTSGEAPVDMSAIADLADKMAYVADNRLPRAVANVQLDPKEREIFLGLAKRLHSQAVLLKQEAQAKRQNRAQSTMNEITNTCNSCHTMFRSVAGPASSAARDEHLATLGHRTRATIRARASGPVRLLASDV